ncbi:MAG: endonuclease/exonuclease/phosphatase family protein [Luteitalea sp.]
MTALRLLTYNIRYGGTGREADLTATIRACEPDVVLLQEATQPSVVAALAEACGMAQWGTSRRQSLGFMSRTSVEHYAWHQPRYSRHAFLEVVPAGCAIRLFGVHLSAVHAAWTERRRVMEVRALLAGISRQNPALHMLAGDFNTLAPGELLDIRLLPLRLRPFVWLSGGHIRWRTVQQVLDAGYVDAFRHVQPGQPGFTFPTWQPHLRLDYIFLPRAFAGQVTRCEVVRNEVAVRASDHLPLLCELHLG